MKFLKIFFWFIFFIFALSKNIFAHFSDEDSVTANSVSTGWWVAPTIVVLTPNGGETLTAGDSYIITWSAVSTDPAATASVDIFYSLDNGVTYHSLAAGETNDSLYPWTVPALSSTNARIKITAADSHGLANSDESDAVFTIIDPPPVLTVNSKSIIDVFAFGSAVTRLGSDDPVGTGSAFDQNIFSQTIPNIVKNVFFSYNFNSYDYPPYDAPGFQFSVNNKTLLELWAKDVNPAAEVGLHSTGWQNFSFDPAIFSDPSLNLKFAAGNSPNALDLNSWVDFKNLTTATVSANSTSTFSAPLANYPFEIPFKGPPPAIADLEIVATASSSLTLRWTSNGGVAYDLNNATPRPKGEEIETTISGLNPATNYCYTVKSVDDTPQWSPPSNTVCAETAALPLSPSLSLSYQNPNVSFTVSNLADFEKLSYQLIYETDGPAQGAIGESNLAPGQTDFTREIYTGTCSAGGTCVPHNNVHSIGLTVILTRSDLTTETLHQTL